MAGDSATFVAAAPTCGKEGFMSSKFGTTLNQNYGMIYNFFSAIPQGGTNVVYSAPFQINHDFPAVLVHVYNVATMAYPTTITLQYTFDFSTWNDLSTSIYQRVMLATGTNDFNDYILTSSLLNCVAFRFKYDTSGNSPIGGGTAFFEVKQLAGMIQ